MEAGQLLAKYLARGKQRFRSDRQPGPVRDEGADAPGESARADPPTFNPKDRNVPRISFSLLRTLLTKNSRLVSSIRSS